MGLFSGKNNGGLMDVIRCDEQNYLVWKWHPEGAQLGESKKENAIRWGSSLRVKEGSAAVFVYSGSNGSGQDFIVGPADTILNTDNLPVIASIVGLAYAGGSPFQAEIYFINLAETVQMKFAVPYMTVNEVGEQMDQYGVPVSVRGSFDFNIGDCNAFIKKHRLDHFSIEDLQSQVKDSVSEIVKGVVLNAPEKYDIPVIHIEKKIYDIKCEVLPLLKEKLFNSYGISLSDVNISAIEIDKDSAEYKEYKAVTKDLTTAKLKNEMKVEIREKKGNTSIGLLNKAYNTLSESKNKQFDKRKEIEEKHAEIIEDERAGKIGAISGKFMRDLGKLIHGSDKKASQTTPPPIPAQKQYNVAVDGNPTGPFDIDTLSDMVQNGQLNKNSLVWTKGMSEWVKAGTVDELSVIFDEMPPIPKE